MICPAKTQVELRAPGHSHSGGGGHEFGLAICGKCKASLELALPGHGTPGLSASDHSHCLSDPFLCPGFVQTEWLQEGPRSGSDEGIVPKCVSFPRRPGGPLCSEL